MRAEIVSPEAVLWRGTASAVVASSSEGDFTVLDHHTATAGDVVSTVVRVSGDEGDVAFAVHAGFFQVRSDGGETTVSVLASVAERTDEIDVARAQRARETAEASVSAAGEDEQSRERALDDLRRAELRLSAAAR